MKNICVFCGSSSGKSIEFGKAAHALGQLIADNKLRLIYGGGNVGLMGIVADAVLENGGEVIGVIPDFLLQKEVGHLGLTELIVVDSMHERKQKMAELSDAFIALPGGFGTLEELAEIITWVQLGLVKKPVALLNTLGYYDHLLAYLDKMTQENFTSLANRQILTSENNPKALLENLIKDISNYSQHTDIDKT